MEEIIKKAVSRALRGCERKEKKIWKYDLLGFGHAEFIKVYVLPDGKELTFTAICRDIEKYYNLHGLTLTF